MLYQIKSEQRSVWLVKRMNEPVVTTILQICTFQKCTFHYSESLSDTCYPKTLFLTDLHGFHIMCICVLHIRSHLLFCCNLCTVIVCFAIKGRQYRWRILLNAAAGRTWVKCSHEQSRWNGRWRGFLSSRLPESDIQRSIVFVICFSNLYLSKYKNDNSSCSSVLATRSCWETCWVGTHLIDYSDCMPATFAGW